MRFLSQICVWFGVFCRFSTVLLFLGSMFEKIFGSELLFYGVGVGLVCFGAVLPMFLLYYLFFRSRNCLEKILLMSGLVFLGFFSPPLVFFADVVVLFVFASFFLERQLSSHRAHPHTRFAFLFLFLVCVPRRNRARVYLPFWPCVLSFWRFVGVPFWAPGDLAIFGLSRYLGGLRLLAPLLRPFSRTRGGKGASLLLVLVLFFPFCFGLRLHTFSSSPSRLSSRSGRNGTSKPAPRESDPQGGGFLRGGLVPSISGFLTASFGSQRVTGTLRAFLIWGGGALSAPSGPFSHALVFVSRPRFFFRGQRPWITCNELQTWNDAFQAMLRRIPRNSLNAIPKHTLSATPLSAFILCAKANSPSFSQNSPSFTRS